MPTPHRTYEQVIKRRLVGKDGAERAREPRAILTGLPMLSRRRQRVVHRKTFAVRREGVAQIALVGSPASARLDGQRVGRGHLVADGDVVRVPS